MLSNNFNISFGEKIWLLLLSLFKSCNTMLSCSEGSWSYIERFIQKLATFWHWFIAILFWSSFVSTFATKHVHFDLLIIFTIRFPAYTEHFCTSKIFRKEFWIPFIVFLVCVATHSWKQIVCCVGSENVCQPSDPIASHSSRFSERIKFSKFYSDRAK